MAISINTNYSAFLALQNLNKTNEDIERVQTRLNTGLRVNSPLDDAAVFAVANRLRSDIKAYSSVQGNIDRQASALDTAVSAATSINDLLIEMKAVAISARDSSLDAAARNTYNAAFTALRDQISTIIKNASFDGTNLVNASSTFRVLADTKGTTFSIALKNLSTTTGGTGSVLSFSGSGTVSTAAKASTMVQKLSTSIANLATELSRMGGFAKQINFQKSFVIKLVDNYENSVSNLVDADVAKESARLQGLQIKQQLGVQALSIANSAPSILLALFR